MKFYIYIFVLILFACPVYCSDSTVDTNNDSIKDFIVGLVVPDEDYWNDCYNSLNDKLKEKLPFEIYESTIGRVLNFSETSIDDLQLPLFTGVLFDTEFTMDFNALLPPEIVQTLRSLVSGFTMLYLVRYNYNQILYLVRGSTNQSKGG